MTNARKRRSRNERGVIMGWILLEAGIALAIGIFIVWWTMGARRKPPAPPQPDERERQ